MIEKLDVSISTVNWEIAALKKKRVLYRHGGDKDGRWIVLIYELCICRESRLGTKIWRVRLHKSMKPYIDIAEKAKTDAMDAMEKALGE